MSKIVTVRTNIFFVCVGWGTLEVNKHYFRTSWSLAKFIFIQKPNNLTKLSLFKSMIQKVHCLSKIATIQTELLFTGVNFDYFWGENNIRGHLGLKQNVACVHKIHSRSKFLAHSLLNLIPGLHAYGAWCQLNTEN